MIWCLDRVYEYVEADLSKAELLRSHDDQEKDRFLRIIEAMLGKI